MQHLTSDFSAYLLRKSETITETHLRCAEACLLDYLAVTEAGAKTNAARWALLSEYLPVGKVPLLGTERTTDGKTAALINGFNAHSLELDDGHRFAMIHLGAAIISSLISARAEFCFTGEALRKGVIMGYEAACRVSITMQPSHKQRGYHTAGTCGTIGAAVAVAFALGFDREQLQRALTLSTGSAAGMLEIQEQSSELKPYNLGRAAMDGLAAAWMGLTDFALPEDMLGGERGFFRLFADEAHPEKLTADTDRFEIQRIYVKPYASCRHSHSAVEAAIALHPLTVGAQIRSVTVETYRLGVKGHDHTQIPGIASAKLSTPYAVALGLLRGRADYSAFLALDPDVLDLCKAVSVREREDLTAACPQKRIAALTVECADGTRLTKQVDYAKGEPENPMTREELLEKAASLVGWARVHRIIAENELHSFDRNGEDQL